MTVWGKIGAREVPISPDVRRLMMGVGEGEVLWVAEGGRRWGEALTTSGVQQAVRRALARVEVKGGPHLWRHSFAVGYIRAGGDLVSLQRILGHHSIESTRIYLEFDWEGVRAQHQRFSPARAVLGGWEGRYGWRG